MLTEIYLKCLRMHFQLAFLRTKVKFFQSLYAAILILTKIGKQCDLGYSLNSFNLFMRYAL